MTVKYGEILRLASKGFSRRNIALSVPCSRNTVAKVLERAEELNLSWPLPDGMDEPKLSKLLFGQENKPLQSCRHTVFPRKACRTPSSTRICFSIFTTATPPFP